MTWTSYNMARKRDGEKAGKAEKTGRTGRTGKAGNSGKVEKSGKSAKLLKSKLSLKAKHTKAQIERLDKDAAQISSIHSELVKNVKNVKNAPEVKVLDAKSLRDGLKKDEKAKSETQRAETDLAGQLELITGMSL